MKGATSVMVRVASDTMERLRPVAARLAAVLGQRGGGTEAVAGVARPKGRSESFRPYAVSAILALVAVGSIALAGPRSPDRRINVAGSTELRGSEVALASRPLVEPKRREALPTFAWMLGSSSSWDDASFVAAAYAGLGYAGASIPIAPVTPRVVTAASKRPGGEPEIALPETDWDRLAEAADAVLPNTKSRTNPNTTGSLVQHPTGPRAPVAPIEPQGFEAPTRLLRERRVTPHTNPDFDVKVNDRARIGVFGEIGDTKTKVDPRTIDLRGDVGAGVTFQYKFESH